MKRPAAFFALLPLTLLSVALAAKTPRPEKPMDCWDCKGFCAPAKYAKVRYPSLLPPFWSSPVFAAAAKEGALAFALVGGLVVSRRRSARRATSVPFARSNAIEPKP